VKNVIDIVLPSTRLRRTFAPNLHHHDYRFHLPPMLVFFEKVFNEFNARSIDDHPNILRQLHRNKWFTGILAFTAAMQVGFFIDPLGTLLLMF